MAVERIGACDVKPSRAKILETIESLRACAATCENDLEAIACIGALSALAWSIGEDPGEFSGLPVRKLDEFLCRAGA